MNLNQNINQILIQATISWDLVSSDGRGYCWQDLLIPQMRTRKFSQTTRRWFGILKDKVDIIEAQVLTKLPKKKMMSVKSILRMINSGSCKENEEDRFLVMVVSRNLIHVEVASETEIDNLVTYSVKDILSLPRHFKIGASSSKKVIFSRITGVPRPFIANFMADLPFCSRCSLQLPGAADSDSEVVRIVPSGGVMPAKTLESQLPAVMDA
ncbi:hypothetical protein FB45DRAFT_921801 [Roridomyces roridus]|uniref:Uncharacterized protein n=1 Tax=Roridomyces roridus TaxID=1738132 RepID=A0AAD7BMU1_9AGAR|nr:hypothetical protein FB45DRAFT_921801 [Roridomyces roridus]